MTSVSRLFLSGLCGILSTACALTNKAEPLSLRYFAPPHHQQASPESAAEVAPLMIRVNRVEVAEHLTENIAYRRSESELAYYNTLRWTEPPDVYLDRALDDALFSGNEMRRGLVDPTYTITVELEAFEELRYGDSRARVAVYVAIADAEMVLRERRLIVDAPVTRGTQGREVALVEAFGRALNEVAASVRQEVRSVAAEQREEASRVSEFTTAQPDNQVPAVPK